MLCLSSSNLLATFWSLELYDVRFPQQRYATELDRLANILSDLDREAPNLVGSVAREQNKGLRAKVVQLRETLLLDTKIHLKQWELTRNRLLAEKSTWFPGAAAVASSPRPTHLTTQLLSEHPRTEASLSISSSTTASSPERSSAPVMQHSRHNSSRISTATASTALPL